MKKLSFDKIIKEADVLMIDQNLKFNVSQKLPKYFQLFMKQLQSDQYDAATETLSNIIATAQEAQKQLVNAIKSNPQVKQPGIQISDKEI